MMTVTATTITTTDADHTAAVPALDLEIATEDKKPAHDSTIPDATQGLMYANDMPMICSLLIN